jgi:hypothetical protein
MGRIRLATWVMTATLAAACGGRVTGEHPEASTGGAGERSGATDGVGGTADSASGTADAVGATADGVVSVAGSASSVAGSSADAAPSSSNPFGPGGRPLRDSDGDYTPDYVCSGWATEPERLGAALFLVLDASSSMQDGAPGTGDQSMWEVVRDALTESLHALSDETMVGMLAFPNRVVEGSSGDPSMCVNIDALVPLDMLGQNGHRETLIDALGAVELNTCTPTHDAYVIGLGEHERGPVAGHRYMLLMTDGRPTLNLNCEPGQCTNDLPGSEQAVVDEVANAYANQNITTFVFGLPGSLIYLQGGVDERRWLSEAAELGGTSPGNCSHEGEPYCHYDLIGYDDDFPEELRAALHDVVEQVKTCDYPIPPPPPDETIDPNVINVVIRLDGVEPTLIYRSADPECEYGWYYDQASSLVSLCRHTCGVVQADPNASLELLFGCESETMPAE